MAICQVMIRDFMYRWGDPDGAYGERDLKIGIQYCKDLIEMDNLKREPFHHYDLKKFIAWAENHPRMLKVLVAPTSKI